MYSPAGIGPATKASLLLRHCSTHSERQMISPRRDVVNAIHLGNQCEGLRLRSFRASRSVELRRIDSVVEPHHTAGNVYVATYSTRTNQPSQLELDSQDGEHKHTREEGAVRLKVVGRARNRRQGAIPVRMMTNNDGRCIRIHRPANTQEPRRCCHELLSVRRIQLAQYSLLVTAKTSSAPPYTYSGRIIHA